MSRDAVEFRFLVLLMILIFQSLSGCGDADEFVPPADPEPVNVSLVQNMSLQIDGKEELVLTGGETHKITGEFELIEESAPLEFMMVKVLIHSDEHREGIIAEAIAETTLIEGSRYAFTSDLTINANKPGEVELRLITNSPGKRGQVPIYREIVTIQAPVESTDE